MIATEEFYQNELMLNEIDEVIDEDFKEDD
jgi:hypothetical protein